MTVNAWVIAKDQVRNDGLQCNIQLSAYSLLGVTDFSICSMSFLLIVTGAE